ncbi:unnamed protein product [Hapterophycus canaliculatus]
MDENFNPNRVVQGSGEVFGKSSASSHGGGEGASCCADGNAPLFAMLGALEDGQVGVAGDIVAIRAGPETYHPIKALKGMASESDVIVLSCLTKAPAAGEATSAVRSALQSVIVRPPPAMIHSPGPGGRATTAGGVVHDLRAISPSAHSAVVDSSLLRAFTPTRARTVLAGLTPPPAGGSTGELPTIVAGVCGGGGGLCLLGQRATSEGFSAFSVRRESELEGDGGEEQGEMPRIDELLCEFGGRARASARALYDLWGTSNGDLVGGGGGAGGGSQAEAKEGPFARLATEWDCSSHATRALGTAPPPACSSLLLVGGECPPSTVSLALRGDIETLSAAAAVGHALTPRARRKTKGPFGNGSGGVDDGGSDGASLESERQERERWDEDLEVLLSGSENMAAFAALLTNAPAGDGDGENGSERHGAGEDDDTAVQERNDGGGLGEEEIDSSRQERAGKLRGDLDFSERLWDLAARASDVEGVRAAIGSAFEAVGEGQIFPVISRDNKTTVGNHIRDGVSMAREARRYHDGSLAGIGVPPAEANAKAWRERGSALLAGTETLAKAFVELGVHKVTRDLLHWLEVHAGVLAADVDRALPTAVGARPAASSDGDGGDRRLDRLLTLADTLDLVALAQSYGAPWRQLAHPVFWELFLEPAMGGGMDGGLATGTAWETVSYTLARAGLFQLGGADEPPVLSRETARAAQAALHGCPAHLVPEVLSSVTGDESFLALKRRQLERKAKVPSAGSDAAAVFVCEQRFTPW